MIVLSFLVFVGLGCNSGSDNESHMETMSEENHAGHDHESHDEVLASEYACPMECEDNKTYTVAGECPVCKMDLVVVESEEEE